MIGVGGIGSGRFFALKGNHTLGREESRAGYFLPGRDYCKLHIITHYVKKLLGPEFATIPIGKVGADEAGQRLLEEMKQAGIDTRCVQVCPEAPTLYSLCFLYPDRTGGNLTTDDSACNRVDAASIQLAEGEFVRYAQRGITLAVPEVPLDAREKLLRLGRAHHCFGVASFTSAEMPTAMEMGMLSFVDLLAINVDEAAAGVGIPANATPVETIVAAAVDQWMALNPSMQVAITAGTQGSWVWDGRTLTHTPAFPVVPVSTAGAGDAFLAGMIVGLVAGLDLPAAQQMGTLIAAFSVTSPHTIHPETERETLHSFATAASIPLDRRVRDLLSA